MNGQLNVKNVFFPSSGIGNFTPMDEVFADFIVEQSNIDSSRDAGLMLKRIALLTSSSVRAGHTCCDFSALAGKEYPPATERENYENFFVVPELSSILRFLRLPGHETVLMFHRNVPEGTAIPMLFDGTGKVWLNRYYTYERELAQRILSLRGFSEGKIFPGKTVAEISCMFANAGPGPDFQQLAVYGAYHAKFSIITGGPGTGKSTVVAALLALEFKHNPDLTVHLCAPTGKAQAKLLESIRKNVQKLNCPESVREKLLNLSCGTVHSLVGLSLDGMRARFDRENPLPSDLVVVDESSMISLSLMFRLFRALKKETRVILLGDRFQLASVDAGSILSELCSCAFPNVLPPELAKDFYVRTGFEIPSFAPDCPEKPLSGCVTELQKNYRSKSAPEILRFSTLVRGSENAEMDCGLLTEEIVSARFDDFKTEKLPSHSNLAARLRDMLLRPCTPFPGENEEKLHAFSELRSLSNDPSGNALEKIFALLDGFCILSAVRKGVYGIENLNGLAGTILGFHSEFEPGIPVMVLANKPSLQLNNGDTGIFRKTETGLKVFFRTVDPVSGKTLFRSYYPTELPAYEPAFAMTVHKSQGSGFRNVLTILPDRPNPVLTRELLYTAITRAEKHHFLWANSSEIHFALEHRTIRHSGLADRVEDEIP